VHLLANAAADVACGVLEGVDGQAALLGGEDGDVDDGVVEVRGDVDVGDGDQAAGAGIVEALGRAGDAAGCPRAG